MLAPWLRADAPGRQRPPAAGLGVEALSGSVPRGRLSAWFRPNVARPAVEAVEAVEAGPAPSATSATSWFHRGALIAILAFAALLRVAYGWPQPDGFRAIDERFGLENVEALMRSRSFTPVTSYHPSLSYLPQTAALALVEACDCVRLGTPDSRVLAPRANWRFANADRARPSAGVRPLPHLTPLAYRSCRLFQAVLGTASVLLVYWLARRLMSPGVGLGAAMLAAGVPWLIWSSSICNEDAFLILMFLVVALATLRTCERPTTARFAWLGVACGMALAAKLNGGVACLPIVLWVAWRRREWRRSIPRLALAGAIAAGTFVGLNPHFVTRFDLVQRDFSVTLRLYERKSNLARNAKGPLATGLLTMLDREALGPLAGGAAMAGALLLARRRRGYAADGLTLATVALGFPATYLLSYSLATGNAAPHNWLPMMPFFAVLGAAAAAALWRLRPAAPSLALVSRTVARTVAIAILGAPAGVSVGICYRSLVPTTVAIAQQTLDRVAVTQAFVGVEVPRRRGAVGERELERIVIVPERKSARFTAEARARLDGWIEPAPAHETALRALSLPDDAQAEIVRPWPFSRWGPAVRVVWRPWRLVRAESRELLASAGSRQRFLAPPKPSADAQMASLRLRPSRRLRAHQWCSLRGPGGSKIALHGRPDSSVESGRYDAREAEALVLDCPSRRGQPPFSATVEIFSWTREPVGGPERSPADDGR